MEDFKILGYFIKVEYNDYDYLYYFIDYDDNIDIETIMQEKVKDIPNGTLQFNCSSYEVYEILNNKYDKFRTSNRFLIEDLFKAFKNYDNSRLILSNPYNFSIDTITTLPYQKQIEKLKSLINKLTDIDDNINYDTVNNMINILQSLSD